MSWFVFVVHLENRVERERMAAALAEQNIPVRPYFVPIHVQPYFVDRFGFQPQDYPNTLSLGECGLALPFSGVMTETQVDIVCQNIRQFL
jgi:dTDP-4-amino-4,6-dideoxygalactose transaminase